MIPLEESHIVQHFTVHTQIEMLNIKKAFTAYYNNNMSNMVLCHTKNIQSDILLLQSTYDEVDSDCLQTDQ